MNRAICYSCTAVAYGWVGFNSAMGSASAADVPRTPTRPENHATHQPNAIIQISGRLLADVLQRDIERNTVISDNVLGTSVRGTAITRLHVVPQLVPDNHRGLLQFRFTGTTISPRMVGRNGPATSFSSSFSKVDVRKTVILSQLGVFSLPAVATCQTRLSIDDVIAKRRIVQRIARRQASRTQGASQAITSEHTRLRVQEEVDLEAARVFARANNQFLEVFRSSWLEREALPKLCRFSTTSKYLRMELGECGHSPYLAPKNAPQIDAQHDFVVILHQSAAKGVYEMVFGRQIANDHTVLLTTHSTSNTSPPPLRLKIGTPATSIELAAREPLELGYADGAATVRLHATSVASGKRKYDGEFTVLARYGLEKTGNGPRLHRQGDLLIEGHTQSGLPGERAAAFSMLRQCLAVLPPNVSLDDLIPRSGSILDKLGALQLAKLDTQNGWLVAGYQMPSNDALIASHRGKP